MRKCIRRTFAGLPLEAAAGLASSSESESESESLLSSLSLSAFFAPFTGVFAYVVYS
jgi:hypothetical protein